MNRLGRIPLLAALLPMLGVACSDDQEQGILAPEAPLARAASEPLSETNFPLFSFLPPMAPDPPPFAGTFDPSLLPHVAVEICEVVDDDCGPEVARFTAEGTRSERVRIPDDEEHYIVNWHTRRPRLRNGLYHIEVRVAGTEVGHTDVQLVTRGRDLRTVPPDAVGLKNGQTLPIKFRIEEGAVNVIGPDGATITGLDGQVVLEIPAGALTEPTGIAIVSAPDEPPLDDGVPGSTFELHPADLVLQAVATLTIQVDPPPPLDDPNEDDEFEPVLLNVFEDGWEEVETAFDADENFVEYLLDRFLPEEVEESSSAPAIDATGPAGPTFHSPRLRIRLPRFRRSYRRRSARRCWTDVRIAPRFTTVLVDGRVGYRLTAKRRTSRRSRRPSPFRRVSSLQARWFTGPAEVATINDFGVLTAIGVGRATTRASYPRTASRYCRSGSATAFASVLPAVASVEVTPATSAIEVGETVALSATLRDADGDILTGPSVAWSSSDIPIATVDGTGLVTGVAAGEATITATSQGVPGTATVTVTAPGPAPPVVFSDGTFNAGDWQLALATNGPGGTGVAFFDAVFEGIEGNPGTFMRIKHVHNPSNNIIDPSQPKSNILTFHRRIGAEYDPSTLGAITSIDYSEDRILFECGFSGCDGQVTGPAVLQDGDLYVVVVGNTNDRDVNRVWGALSSSGLTANNFSLAVVGVNFPGPNTLIQDFNRHPDFSSSGSPMVFGFFRAGTHTAPIFQTRMAGIDNWQVTVNR